MYFFTFAVFVALLSSSFAHPSPWNWGSKESNSTEGSSTISTTSKPVVPVVTTEYMKGTTTDLSIITKLYESTIAYQKDLEEKKQAKDTPTTSAPVSTESSEMRPTTTGSATSMASTSTMATTERTTTLAQNPGDEKKLMDDLAQMEDKAKKDHEAHSSEMKAHLEATTEKASTTTPKIMIAGRTSGSGSSLFNSSFLLSLIAVCMSSILL